jgi:hypothetical protein
MLMEVAERPSLEEQIHITGLRVLRQGPESRLQLQEMRCSRPSARIAAIPSPVGKHLSAIYRLSTTSGGHPRCPARRAPPTTSKKDLANTKQFIRRVYTPEIAGANIATSEERVNS